MPQLLHDGMCHHCARIVPLEGIWSAEFYASWACGTRNGGQSGHVWAQTGISVGLLWVTYGMPGIERFCSESTSLKKMNHES